ncbi:AMP-binding protein [Shewanella sp. SNU WT4]|uniref:AMP-binding protein n=1 Tax=Shewanella sp. SNU WT4 TaxID=2590015 RepID=UPI00112BE00C|nr:AMP-binding protein [Shewanella sp. SNU WT4]QDF68041.1 AMP-binding protein [Shewanella sp. SNU WT4]
MEFDICHQLVQERYKSLVDMIEISCQRYAEHTAFACLGKTFTFSDIERDSRHFAAYLQHNTQLKPGDRIAIQLPNITQFVIAAFGALRAGLILVNTNPLYTERELTHQFNDSGAKALVVLSDLLPTLAKVVNNTAIEYVISTHALDLISPQVQPKTGIKNIELLKMLSIGATLEYQAVDSQSSDIAALQYTGGTTGISKGAILSHGNLLANAWQCHSRLGGRIIAGEEIFIAPLPIYHIYAFLVNLVLYFEQGGCSVLIPNPRDIPALIATMAKYRFTGFAGINTLFVGLCHHPSFKSLDFSQLKLTISGGAALTPIAAKLWQATTGCSISEGYGLSETSPVVSLNCPGKEVLGTIGRPVLGTEVRILNGEGIEVALGEAGELAVKGPQVMQGYWQRPKETADVMTVDGFFRTGDIAIADANGMHTIVDRIKDIIIVSGFNVYPNEVEGILSSHPKVLECAVVGVHDNKSGEAVRAVIVLTPETAACDELKREIKDFCAQQLTAYKLPKIIDFVEQLPKSTVGKVLRRQLRSE